MEIDCFKKITDDLKRPAWSEHFTPEERQQIADFAKEVDEKSDISNWVANHDGITFLTRQNTTETINF